MCFLQNWYCENGVLHCPPIFTWLSRPPFDSLLSKYACGCVSLHLCLCVCVCVCLCVCVCVRDDELPAEPICICPQRDPSSTRVCVGSSDPRALGHRHLESRPRADWGAQPLSAPGRSSSEARRTGPAPRHSALWAPPGDAGAAPARGQTRIYGRTSCCTLSAAVSLCFRKWLQETRFASGTVSSWFETQDSHHLPPPIPLLP